MSTEQDCILNMEVQELDKNGKPEICVDSNDSDNKKQGSLLSKVITDQMLTLDPVEKGPFITVDNSPRSSRNVNVIKAKLREQESRHTLEMVRIKREYEVREEALNTEVIGLRTSLSVLQGQSEAEVKLRKDAERREEQISKDLLVISGKCGELQGRLDESHAALQESRSFIETLRASQEEKLSEIKKLSAESEERHQDTKRGLERKIRELEELLTETRSCFQKALSEKLDQWKIKEAEFMASIKQEEVRNEQLTKEKNTLAGKLEETEIQFEEACNGRESLISELNELREYQKMEINQLQDEFTNCKREWDERMDGVNSELQKVHQDLSDTQLVNQELLSDKEKTLKKHEESVKVLKDALTVLDEQNKELTVELKRTQDKYEEKESVCATLASQVNSVLAERNDRESENEKLQEEKAKLENDVTNKLQIISDITAQKDSEINQLQQELTRTLASLTEETEEKNAAIAKLEAALKNLKECMDQSLEAKDSLIHDLKETLENERSKAATEKEENEKMKDSVREYSENLDAINVQYEGCKQQVTKLNLEMSRLINEVVNIKEENIDLKSGLNEALQKGDFYKDRNFAITEQLAEIQRMKVEKEAELEADIQEKKTLIEYLQNQLANATPGASEKKKRRFFQTIKSVPSSPLKMDTRTSLTSQTNEEHSSPRPDEASS